MLKIINQTGCAKAWLEGAEYLRSCDSHRDYNLILNISKPMQLLADDKTIYDTVDTFLRDRGDTSLSTVINTIFPATRYARKGSAVMDDYDHLWPIINKRPCVTWGTYARRMMHRVNHDGSVERPLLTIIDKLKKQAKCGAPKHAAYELGVVDVFADIPVYDSEKDEGPIMGMPCLSHLSFKLLDDRSLMLTAFYRSHYYVERAFGNLLGLAWLQHFVAKEANIQSANLVCISSMAQLEIKTPKNCKGWRVAEVNALLNDCRSTAGKVLR
jgi:hypothetical protein